jgi:hypothetical protein
MSGAFLLPEICPKKNENRLKHNEIKRSVGGAYGI